MLEIERAGSPNNIIDFVVIHRRKGKTTATTDLPISFPRWKEVSRSVSEKEHGVMHGDGPAADALISPSFVIIILSVFDDKMRCLFPLFVMNLAIKCFSLS